MTPRLELANCMKPDYEVPGGHLEVVFESLSNEEIERLLEDPKARAAVQPLLTEERVHTGDRRLAWAVE